MRKITDINQGDLLTFKAADNRYKALLCISTYKEKSPQNYTFAALTYDSIEKPSIENLYESEFFGIGNTRDEYYSYSEEDLKRIWTIHPEVKPYCLGAYGLLIFRKDFMKIRDNFEFIGNFKIIDNLDKQARGSMNASDWALLKDFFSEKYKTLLPERGQKTFKVKSIVRTNERSTCTPGNTGVCKIAVS
jgi:hypothetical protein